MFLLNFITFASSCCFFAEAARILAVVPTPSISHQVVFRPLTQELVKRGHEVVVLTADPAFPKGDAPENLTEIDLHEFSYQAWREVVFSDMTSGSSADSFGMVSKGFQTLFKIFEMQLQTEEMKNVISKSNNHFDLLILEAVILPALALTHIFKVPVISMSSLGGFIDEYDIVGAPSRPPLLFPNPLHQRLVNLTLWEKIMQLYKHYKFKNFFDSMVDENDRLMKKLFGPDMPTTVELYNNIDLMFFNVHPMWDFNRPVPPNVIYMGGMHQKQSKDLPKDLKTYLDSSKNGVIYISYGTNVSPSHLPPEKIQVLVKAFSELPYDVLWKWDKDELPNRTPNIKLSKWLPQSDLLKHPKVKLFVTQGGLQSTDEAITAGVPLLGMPMLGDQWFNVEMYLHHGIGLRLDMDQVTTDNFKHAVNTIINDDSYRKNIAKLCTLMNDQPQKPLERAVWWTEHLLRHGGASHLKAVTANMTWSEYLDLELLAAIGLCALLVLTVLGLVANLLFGFVSRNFLSGGKIKTN